MMRRMTRTWTAIAAVGLLGVGALAAPALAQSDADDTTVQDDARPSFEDRREAFHEGLAEELGITVEELEAARDAVRADLFAEHLQAQVDAGRLTAEEAEQLRQAHANGNVAEVRAALRLAHLEERLQERVDAGDLTQQEADEILQRAEEGDLPGRGRPGHRGRGGHGPMEPTGPGDGAGTGFGGMRLGSGTRADA